MKVGKITRLGNSYAVIVHRSNLRRLGWVKGDYITQAIAGDQLVLKNMRAPKLFPIHTRREDGDPNSGRA